MPKQKQILFTPYEGKKKVYPSLIQACDEHGLKYWSISKKFDRMRRRGDSEVHLWEGGKIEVL